MVLIIPSRLAVLQLLSILLRTSLHGYVQGSKISLIVTGPLGPVKFSHHRSDRKLPGPRKFSEAQLERKYWKFYQQHKNTIILRSKSNCAIFERGRQDTIYLNILNMNIQQICLFEAKRKVLIMLIKVFSTVLKIYRVLSDRLARTLPSPTALPTGPGPSDLLIFAP